MTTSLTRGLSLAWLLAGAAPLTAQTAATAPPTFANVSYGPHERHVLDFWQANGSAPTPLAHLHPRRRMDGR